jgi:integrase
MMTKPRVLTEPFIKALKPAAKGKRYAISDAIVPGLRLRITDTGHKSYVLWRRVDPRSMSASALALGTVGQLTLAEARTKARKWIAQLAEGTDPRTAERRARADTLAAAVDMYLQRHVAGQRKAADTEREIKNELVARWGHRALASIRRADVIAMIDEIVDRGARAQARNILTHCKTFFGFAVERGLLENSPADHVSPLRLIGPKVHRQRVLDDDELRALWAATETLDYPLGPYLQMLTLTGQRRSEVARAQWSEFDLTNKIWVIPAERYKSNAPHIVPLSDSMCELLEQLPRWTSGDFLFSTTGGRAPINISR